MQCKSGEGGFRQCVLINRNIYVFTLQEKLTKIHEMTSKWHFKEEKLPLNCTPVTWFIFSHVQQSRWRCTSPWTWAVKMRRWNMTRQGLFFSSKISSQQAGILIISCLVTLTARLHQCPQTPWWQFQRFQALQSTSNHKGLFLGSGTFSSASSRAHSFPIKRWASRVIFWSWEFSKSKISSVSHVRICALDIIIYWIWGRKT